MVFISLEGLVDPYDVLMLKGFHKGSLKEELSLCRLKREVILIEGLDSY